MFLMIAWIFMAMAIFAAWLLLGDLKKEMEYNGCIDHDDIAIVGIEGDEHGLQETAYRQNREFLCRCG